MWKDEDLLETFHIQCFFIEKKDGEIINIDKLIEFVLSWSGEIGSLSGRDFLLCSHSDR